ncbi:Sex-determining protein fem-1 [Lasiodiplodia theobromae]|uniref:Sex-determining protein fem-1 n=1 Tax=Lasiodiplodia theobromae TaxID=45133 RepID=UPI0015C31B08|nr:Sex-determining protein fem-1 [Lasiodiplodia theobromae]KAF4540581.1 Sex-determining protein fem-1 [Lasiodiplodia theobromae]
MPAGKTRKRIRNRLFAPCRSRHEGALNGSAGLNPPARSVTTRTTPDRAVSPIPPSSHGGGGHALHQGAAGMRSRTSIYTDAALTPSYRSHPQLASINVPENGLARGTLKVRNPTASLASGASSAYSVQSCCSPQLSTITESNKGRKTGTKASSSSATSHYSSQYQDHQPSDAAPRLEEPKESARSEELPEEGNVEQSEAIADAHTPERIPAADNTNTNNNNTLTPDWRRRNDSHSSLLKSRAEFCRQPVDSPFAGAFPEDIAATAYALIAASESVQELRDALEWADNGSYCSEKHDYRRDGEDVEVDRAMDCDPAQPMSETAAAEPLTASTDAAATAKDADAESVKAEPEPPISVDGSVSVYSQTLEQGQDQPRDAIISTTVGELFAPTGGDAAAVPSGVEERGEAEVPAVEQPATEPPAPTFFAELTFRPAPLRPLKRSETPVEDEDEGADPDVAMLEVEDEVLAPVETEDEVLATIETEDEILAPVEAEVHDISAQETSQKETAQLEERPKSSLTNDDRITGPVDPASSGPEEIEMEQAPAQDQDHDVEVVESVETELLMPEDRPKTSGSRAVSLPDPDFLIAFPTAEPRAESPVVDGQDSATFTQSAPPPAVDEVVDARPHTPDHAIREPASPDVEMISQPPDDVRSLGDHQQSSPDDGRSPPLDGRDAPTEGSSPNDDTNPPSDTRVPDESIKSGPSEDEENNNYDDECYYPDDDGSSSRDSEYSSSLNGQTLVEEHSNGKEVGIFPPTDAALAEARPDGAEAAEAAAEEQVGQPRSPAASPQHSAAQADGLPTPAYDQLEECPPPAIKVQAVAPPTPETPPQPTYLDEEDIPDTTNNTPFPAFFASKTYSTWSSRGGLLRITGAPGAGKSTLMANLVEHFEETMMMTAANAADDVDGRPRSSNGTIVSYTFHAAEPVMVDPGQHARGKPVSGLLHALGHQLAQQEQQQQDKNDYFLHTANDAPSELATLYAADGDEQQQHSSSSSRWDLSEMELQEVLLKHARTRYCGGAAPGKMRGRRLWVFVDAVDEVGDEEAVSDLLDFFAKLAAVPAVGVCVSAKEDVGKKVFGRCGDDNDLQVRVEDFNADDIADYVRSELAFTLNHFNERDLEAVSQVIEKRSRNVFLWAILAVDMIQRDCRGRTRKQIREAVERLPFNLDEIYLERILNIPAEDREPCLRLFQWVCFATRPLTLRELRVALVLRPETKSLADVYAAPDYIASDADIADVLHHLSRGLLHVPAFDVHSAPIAAPVHASAKDFLVSRNGLDILAAGKASTPTRTTTDLFLSRRLLHFLSFPEYHDTSRDPATLPLASYATYSWHLHAESAEHHGANQADLLDLLHAAPTFPRWWWCHATILSSPSFSHPNQPPLDVMDDRLAELLYIQHRRADLTIFDLAAACGLCSTIGAALTAIAETLSPTSSTSGGLDDVGGASSERTLLHWAAFSGNEAMVDFFLRRPDVRTAAVDRRGQTALHIAVIQGHARIVRTLVAAMPPDVIDRRDEDGRAALHYATLLQDKAVIEALLDSSSCGNRADVNVRDASGATPLFAPCKAGDADVVARFLELGGPAVNVNIRTDDDKNPTRKQTVLHAAVSRRRRAVVRLLVRSRPDLDVNARDGAGDGALALAVRMEDVSMAAVLLERRDLDVNARRQGGDGASCYGPLLAAVSTGNEALVRELLKRPDLDVNARGEHWRSPLSIAVGLGNVAVVRLLVGLRPDLDVNARDVDGCTALMDAVASGREDIVAALLGRADVDVLSSHSVLMSMAQESRSEGVVRLLRERYHRGF